MSVTVEIITESDIADFVEGRLDADKADAVIHAARTDDQVRDCVLAALAVRLEVRNRTPKKETANV